MKKILYLLLIVIFFIVISFIVNYNERSGIQRRNRELILKKKEL